MFVPVLLLLFAVLAAALMAYGTHPVWAQYPGGLEFILLARRLQWPMVALALLLCLALLGLVIAGRRRAWWLIGLAPVLALFVHRFYSDPAKRFACLENPPFVPAAEARHVADDDWVVTLDFGDGHYAYPYAALFGAPVLIHAEHDKRVAVMWSAYANRAVAVPVGREFRAADLEVVGTPGNVLIVYNGRVGQFVNGATGLTPAGDKPDGVGEPLVGLGKTTWRTWKERHLDDGKVLAPVGQDYAAAPRIPIRPVYPMPAAYAALPGTGFTLVGTKQPLAIPTTQLTAAPLNVSADGAAALVFRDADNGAVRAFDRRVGDAPPAFKANGDRSRKKALLVDDATGAGWNAQGVAVDGPDAMRGKRLPRLAVDLDAHFGVMSFAYQGIEVYGTDQSAAPRAPATLPAEQH